MPTDGPKCSLFGRSAASIVAVIRPLQVVILVVPADLIITGVVRVSLRLVGPTRPLLVPHPRARRSRSGISEIVLGPGNAARHNSAELGLEVPARAWADG